MKRISILLPYKENFSPKYAGAVSLFVKDVALKSKYKNSITVFGSTKYKEKFNIKYHNLDFERRFYESSNIKYAEKFLINEKKINSDLIEIHNRPATFNYLTSVLKEQKIALYFHNDPLTLRGSISVKQRSHILKKASAIIFISEWTKLRFFSGLEHSKENPKVSVVYSSVNKEKLNKKKEKIILFVGKLNPSKGYDLFCKTVIKILDKHKDWEAYVIGDEPRAKIDITHPKMTKLGFLGHKEVLKHFDRASIAVGCSKWDEPMGRIGLESSSRGCATIVSNKGGLPETITDGIILSNLTEKHLFNVLDKLIKNPKYRKRLGNLAYKNFKNDLDKSSKEVDLIRNNLFYKPKFNGRSSKMHQGMRIMHITNFSERHDGRLYFVSVAHKLSNGLIRSGHSVMNYSDRDVMKMGKNTFDLSGKKYLNQKLISAVKNYNPHLLLLGHADLIKNSTLEILKKYNPDIKIAQWFEDPLIFNGPDYFKNKEKILNKLDYIDHSFITTSPDALDFKVNQNTFHFLPIPVDESIERLKIFNNANTIYDVFFAMSHGVNRGVLKSGKKDGREKFLNQLIRKNPEIKFDFYGFNGRQPIWADDFFQMISKSRMALNLSRGEPIKYYSSNRIASLLGNGLLTFIDQKTKLGDFFDPNEVIFYKNINDLSDKMKYYSGNDSMRRSVAKRGWAKYHKLFNSESVSKYIINKTFEIGNKRKILWEK
tara:strand:- start:7560 stop:9695 length:2136 start_codon:yes stop_codon:yes gene_type:complete